MVEDKLQTNKKPQLVPQLSLVSSFTAVTASAVHLPLASLAETSQIMGQRLLVAPGPQQGLSSRQVFKESQFHQDIS